MRLGRFNLLKRIYRYIRKRVCMTKEEKRVIAIGILPWAGLKEDTRVGPVTFWSWDSTRVQDEDVKKQLERFFKIFVDHYGKAVSTITVCSHGEPNFRIFEEKEYKELQAAINILVFSAICPAVKQGVCSSNYRIAPPTAERYDFFGQKFNMPNDPLVVVGTRSSTHFEDIDKVHISTPWGVSGPWGTTPDKELLSAFDKLFDEDILAEMRQRLFRSLEWFRLAHTDANNVSEASRLVMMCTAFEILLNFPDNKKSVYFAKQVENRLKRSNSITEMRKHKDSQYTYIEAAWWAYDFYQLRNKIVHGGEFKPEDGRYKDRISYNIVADLVFWELIVKELTDNNCLGERARKLSDELKPQEESKQDFEELVFSLLKGFGDYHEALDWVSK